MSLVDQQMTREIASEQRAVHGVLTCKKHTLVGILITTLSALWVYFRFIYADDNFSYDYQAYVTIFERISELSFSELLGDNLIFPYILAQGITAIEVGFGLLIKAVSLTGAAPETAIALIAAFSVALRVQVMHSLGMPSVWILLVNMYAITLLEANALRLGIAVTFLLILYMNMCDDIRFNAD